MLAHNVYFTLNDNSEAARQALLTACKTYLTGYPGVLFFACGTPQQELDRPVNDRAFDVALHVVFDPLASRATCFAVSAARVNDVTAAKRFPIEPGARYVFDKGYYCFAFWANLAAAGCHFVTRLKTNTPVRVTRTRRLPKAAPHILKDQIGHLPERLAASRKNPFAQPIRVVTVEISTGRVLSLATNDLTAPATEIADLYKSRWQVELFFKWVKQNLKLHHFLGASRNAVTLQVIAALIAHLLVRLAQLQGRSRLPAQAILRLSTLTLFQRRPLNDLLREPPPQNTQPPRQLTPAVAHG